MAAFNHFFGGLTGRISDAAASSASVILGTSRQAPTQTVLLLGCSCETLRGVVVVCVRELCRLGIEFLGASEIFSMFGGRLWSVSRRPCRPCRVQPAAALATMAGCGRQGRESRVG